MPEPIKNQVTNQVFIDTVVKRRVAKFASPPYHPALLWLTPEGFQELTTIQPINRN